MIDAERLAFHHFANFIGDYDLQWGQTTYVDSSTIEAWRVWQEIRSYQKSLVSDGGKMAISRLTEIMISYDERCGNSPKWEDLAEIAYEYIARAQQPALSNKVKAIEALTRLSDFCLENGGDDEGILEDVTIIKTNLSAANALFVIVQPETEKCSECITANGLDGEKVVLCTYKCKQPIDQSLNTNLKSVQNTHSVEHLDKIIRKYHPELKGKRAYAGEIYHELQMFINPEEIAKEVYAAMKWASDNKYEGSPAPHWVDDGNSHAQNKAREKAYDIMKNIKFLTAHRDAKKESVKHYHSTLLDDMRCTAVFSDRVTMPVPLYKRIKQALGGE